MQRLELQELVGVFCAVNKVDYASRSIKETTIPPKWQTVTQPSQNLLLPLPTVPYTLSPAYSPDPGFSISTLLSCLFFGAICQAIRFAWSLFGRGILSRTNRSLRGNLSMFVIIQVLSRSPPHLLRQFINASNNGLQYIVSREAVALATSTIARERRATA